MTTAIESAVLEEKFSASPQAVKPIPLLPDWVEDYGLTATELRVYCHVAKRAFMNGQCCDSVVAIASYCRLARNVVLAALQNLTEVYHLLIKHKRPGLTDEYSIAPESTWSEPIPLKDRVLSRHKISTESTDLSLKGMGYDNVEAILYEDTNLVEAEEFFEQSVEYQEESTDPSIQGMGCNELEPVPYFDTNLVEAEELFEQSIEYHQEWLHEEDDVPSVREQTLGASIWRRNKDATRYCQIPPIHNQSVGVEIQRQIEQEGLTAQAVVERAIAFSKVPKLILETLLTINQKLVAGHNWLTQVLPQNTGNQQDRYDWVRELC